MGCVVDGTKGRRWAGSATSLTEVSVEEIGSGTEGKYKILTECGYGIRGWDALWMVRKGEGGLATQLV